MAYTKKRGYRKRPYKKSSYKRKARIPRTTLGAFPLTKIAKLRYCDQIVMNATAGVFASHLFRSNACFDPDFTGTGHQPMGYDQWAGLYTHYVVLGSKITVQFAHATTSDTSPLFCVVRLQRDSASFAGESLSKIMETARSTYTSYANINVNTLGMSRPISRTYSTKKFMNVTDVNDNIARLGASTLANPTEQAFFNVGCRSVSASGDANALDVIVTIDYIVEFSEPLVQAQS